MNIRRSGLGKLFPDLYLYNRQEVLRIKITSRTSWGCLAAKLPFFRDSSNFDLSRNEHLCVFWISTCFDGIGWRLSFHQSLLIQPKRTCVMFIFFCCLRFVVTHAEIYVVPSYLSFHIYAVCCHRRTKREGKIFEDCQQCDRPVRICIRRNHAECTYGRNSNECKSGNVDHILGKFPRVRDLQNSNVEWPHRLRQLDTRMCRNAMGIKNSRFRVGNWRCCEVTLCSQNAPSISLTKVARNMFRIWVHFKAWVEFVLRSLSWSKQRLRPVERAFALSTAALRRRRSALIGGCKAIWYQFLRGGTRRWLMRTNEFKDCRGDVCPRDIFDPARASCSRRSRYLL